VEVEEINTGEWYLRALRYDDRVDDRPALADLGEHDLDYIDQAADDWESDSRYTWAVCVPSTGEMIAEVSLDPKTAFMESRGRPGFEDAAAMAEDTVRNYASEILNIRVWT
jgi:hypothetical protein